MNEVTVLKTGDDLIVPIQVELHDRAARKLQENILVRIEATGARGLVIDVSAVAIVDSFLGRLLVETARMAALMGTATVLVGLRKEVVMTLIQLGLTIAELHTALNLEDGLALLQRLKGGDGEDRQAGPHVGEA